MQHTIKNVEALWPRINQTYKFSSEERRSVPCNALDQNSAYEMSFKMTQQQAKELFAEMQKAYSLKRTAEPTWPEKLEMPFKKDTRDGEDSGLYIGKCKLKGNYNGEATPKPKQYDNKGDPYGDDFMLTTGSKVNIAVTLVPYSMANSGVSLRLRAIQVLEYKEMEASNPFADDVPSTPSADPFKLTAEVDPFSPAKKAEVKPELDDEIPW